MARAIAAFAFLALTHPAFAARALESATIRFGYLEGRIVQLQGERGPEGLAAACPDAKACQCLFSREESGRVEAVRATSVSPENGTVTCPAPRHAERYTQVSLRSKTHGSNLAPLKTELTLAEALGDLAPAKVNRIHKYSCERTFFEGEGVTPNSISCDMSGIGVPQRLGLIHARYDYYLFQNDSMLGFNVPPFTASFFPSICGRQDQEFSRNSCSVPSEIPLFGFYAEAAGPFQIRVSLTSAPEYQGGGAPLTDSYGFVAAPDAEGHCAPGLVPASPWKAHPQSITPGSINGTNPGSNFLTENGSLDNTVVATQRPVNFMVVREASQNPCQLGGINPGSCVEATFASPTLAQSVRYEKKPPTICVIDRKLLAGKSLAR